MDFEAPPPFTGALEEPPDLECDVRMTVDDDDDDDEVQPPDIPIDFISEVRVPSSSGSLAESTSQQPTSSVPQIAESDQNRIEHSADESSNSSPQPSNPEKNCGDDLFEVSTSAIQQEATEDTDFDDFGDFAGVDGEDSKPVQVATASEVVQGVESGWAEFEQKDRKEDQDPPTEHNDEAQTGEWNAFSTADETKNNSWSADFGEFGEAKAETSSDIPSAEISSEMAYDISVMLDADTPPAIDNDSASFDRSFHLWLALRIVEDALALKFEWKGSGHGENLFKTLDVDPTAAGRGTLPPLSTSTVLEPTPFTANGTTRRSVIISREEGAHGAKVLTSDVTASSLVSKNPPTVVESPSFPQADFDWDKSGLTNPTKAASTLQKELDQLGLSNSSTQNLKKPSSQPSMLDMLMASSTKSDRRVNRPPSELSLDARALHDQLPDIEFLRANMIMFPLGEARCSQR
ncbi:hypothetical protein ANCDUO_07924 [Ancylostoma duodenale]|uniref:Aftiphilin clathrin-binding box domain-containing protein n=1 Tax=Ancylostoma duodenale TaxID=51022 RepID=A0A0C2DH61_9BILA|nr:hypothetical protein ANCDUO_07924 [Ancylostoma duodenale]